MRSRKRSAADRSASSGSTFFSRARATAANRRSPTESKSSASMCSARGIGGIGTPAEGARRSSFRAYSGLGRFPGTSPKMPGSRPSSPRLISSQFCSTSAAVEASTSPNTCGWRRISFVRQWSATSSNEPAPRSSSRIERNTTWKSTSPSSSSSLRSSPRCAASASSYDSSTVCGTIERSSCSRSHGHSTRSRREIASRRASASPHRSGALTRGRPPFRGGLRRRLRRDLLRRRGAPLRRRGPTLRRHRHLLRRAGLRRGTAGLRRAAAHGRGRRLLLRRVVALVDDVVLRALRHLLVAVLEVLDEVVQRLLLRLRLEQVLDRRLDLLERLLLRRGDLRDAEDVVAELSLDRTRDHALLRAEDRGVEALLLLALGHAGELAALRLRGVVRGVLLGDLRPRGTRLDGLEGGVRLCLLGGEHDLEVTRLGLGEALLVLVVVVLDRSVGDGALVLDDALLQLVRQDRQLHAVEQVGLALTRGREELLVVGLLRERLLLLLLEGRLHFLVARRDLALCGLLREPLRGDQELQRLIAQPVVLLLALRLERLRIGLRHALRHRLLALRRDALREVRRVRGHGVLRLRAGALRLLLGGRVEPVGELGLRDLRVADLGDGVRWDVLAAATGDHEDGGRERGEKCEWAQELGHKKTV